MAHVQRIAVTGAHGFVAGSVLRHAPDEWQIHALSRQPAPVRSLNLRWHTLDLLDEAARRAALETIEPTAVIHAAAIADIDYCEHHQDEARRVNTELTAQLAANCRELGAKLVFCSSDTVFDGEKGDYAETDLPYPVNVYGRTKVDAEHAVLAASPTHMVARVALVMGLPHIGTGNSFLSRWLPDLRAGCPIGVPDNELRTPIDVVTLGHALLELAANKAGGIVHLSGNDKVNRHQLAQRVAARLGFDPALVHVNNPETIPGRAARPRDASMKNDRARSVLTTAMVDLESAIDRVMATKPHA